MTTAGFDAAALSRVLVIAEKVAYSAAARWILASPKWMAAFVATVLGLLALHPAVRTFVALHPEVLFVVPLLAGLGAAVVALIILCGQYAKTRLALEGTFRACEEIIQQLGTNAQKDIVWLKSCRRIRANYDGYVTREYRIRAIGRLHVWQISAGVSDEAAPIGHLVDLDFQVSADKHRVAYIQSSNAFRRKTVSIFFLPVLEDGEERTVTISYTWPRMFASLEPRWLRTGGLIQARAEEVFSMDLSKQSKARIGMEEHEFLVDPKLGTCFDGFDMKPVGTLVANATLDKVAASGPEGWPGWRLTVKDADSSAHKLVLFRKKPKQN